jgi:quercetin dioxygenase-like cupin family protein
MNTDPPGLGVADDDHEPELNADFSHLATADTEATPWQGSPAEGVQRQRLELIGGEMPRLTTVVRFAPGSAFPEHTHDGGEEFLVLDGVFSDAEGDHPMGSYVRNPPGTRHAPSSRDGCTLFVKLRQFAPGDSRRVVVPHEARTWHELTNGLDRCELHRFGTERVDLLRWSEATTWSPDGGEGGVELFVLDGEVICEGRCLPRHGWLRLPPGTAPILGGKAGTLAWIKTGHLTP